MNNPFFIFKLPSAGNFGIVLTAVWKYNNDIFQIMFFSKKIIDWKNNQHHDILFYFTI